MRPMALGVALTAIIAVLVLQAVAGPVGFVPVLGVTPHGPAGLPASGESLSLVTVWESTYIEFGVEERTYLAVQSDEEWQALWSAIRTNPAPPPEVDFTTKTVIVAIFGSANTGGYSIRIDDVAMGPDATVHVQVTTALPGLNCVVTEAFTYPVHMVAIPKSYGPFVADETEVVYSCE